MAGYEYDRDYHSAFLLGYNHRNDYPADAHFDDHESDLEQKWNEIKGESRLQWEEAKLAARQAWDRLTR